MDRPVDTGNGVENAVNWEGIMCTQGTETIPI